MQWILHHAMVNMICRVTDPIKKKLSQNAAARTLGFCAIVTESQCDLIWLCKSSTGDSAGEHQERRAPGDKLVEKDFLISLWLAWIQLIIFFVLVENTECIKLFNYCCWKGDFSCSLFLPIPCLKSWVLFSSGELFSFLNNYKTIRFFGCSAIWISLSGSHVNAKVGERRRGKTVAASFNDSKQGQ